MRSQFQPVGRWIRPERRLAIYIRDGFMCAYCGTDLRGVTAHEIQLDHLIPRSEGGNNTNENLVTACRACNASRGNKSVADFAPGGSLIRIAALIARPVNVEMAKALIADRAGNDPDESVR